MPRRVPVLRERADLVRSTMRALGFPNGRRLYECLREQFYWQGLLADCLEAAAHSMPRLKQRARFRPPPFLHPCEKGAAPFRIWSVDSIVKLRPRAPDGAESIIVAVDTFTKWVELGTVPALDSHHAAAWFHEHVVCRYGVPAAVRTDRGSEYRGEFDAYLSGMGVHHASIMTRNPRANG